MSTATHNSWKAMMARCYNKSHKHFNYYGGKGVTVCDEWQSYDGFIADMGERPEGMTLDRIDSNKGYSSANCRWATRKEQANNRSSNTIIEFNGIEKTLAHWADELNCSPEVLGQRLKNGWSVKDALTKRVCKNKELTFGGITKNLSQWAKDTGIAYTTIVSRYNNGLSASDVLKGASV